MRFYPWIYDGDDESWAWIDSLPPEIMERSYLLTEGQPCAPWFPQDVTLDISEDYGVKLTDAIPNTEQIHVVSGSLRQILERKSGASIEFLPVKIRDKKKRVVKKEYYLANVLESVACLDKQRSDFDMSHIVKDQVARFRRLALDASRIDPETKVFRLAEMLDLVLVREDLVNEILDAGCTGMTFQRIEDYGSEYRDPFEDEPLTDEP